MKAYKDEKGNIYIHCLNNVYEIYDKDENFISLSSLNKDFISSLKEIEFNFK